MSLIRIKKAEISHIDIINTAKGRTGRQIKAQYKPNVVINGVLYDMSSKENIVFLEDENVAKTIAQNTLIGALGGATLGTALGRNAHVRHRCATRCRCGDETSFRRSVRPREKRTCAFGRGVFDPL